jgi:hypothetical protein
VTGGPATTGLIRDIVNFLSRDSLTVEDVTARIGRVTNDPGGLIPIEVQPVLPGVHAARVARYPDSGLPYMLDLDLAPGARPTVAALKGLLGDYRRARTDWDQPRQLLFYPPAEGTRWGIVVIARLEPAADDVADGRIASISFRRDAR